MAGYEDTRKKIIETLMGRPNGEEIQPENHQDYALNMLNYIRSLELIANGPLIGIATPTTQPVQPNDARACYLAGVAQDRTVTFQNFRNYLGQPIQITNGQMEACLVILIWDTQYWSAETVPTSIISQADQAYYYYNLTIRKTYPSVAAMNADVNNPIGNDGKYIKVGEIVSVVNSTTPSENGIYSYEGAADGWKFQSGMNFGIAQDLGNDPNVAMSQKAVTKELTELGSKVVIEIKGIFTSRVAAVNKGLVDGDRFVYSQPNKCELGVLKDNTSAADYYDMTLDGLYLLDGVYYSYRGNGVFSEADFEGRIKELSYEQVIYENGSINIEGFEGLETSRIRTKNKFYGSCHFVSPSGLGVYRIFYFYKGTNKFNSLIEVDPHVAEYDISEIEGCYARVVLCKADDDKASVDYKDYIHNNSLSQINEKQTEHTDELTKNGKDIKILYGKDITQGVVEIKGIFTSRVAAVNKGLVDGDRFVYSQPNKCELGVLKDNTSAADYYDMTLDGLYLLDGVYYSYRGNGVFSEADFEGRIKELSYEQVIYENGSINIEGREVTADTRIRTKTRFYGDCHFVSPSGLGVYRIFYFYKGTNKFNSFIGENLHVAEYDISEIEGCYARVVLCKADDDKASVDYKDYIHNNSLSQINEKIIDLDAKESGQQLSMFDLNLESNELNDIHDALDGMNWDTQDNNGNYLFQEQIYAKYDELVNLYPEYISKVDAAEFVGLSYPVYANLNGVAQEGYLATPSYKTYMYKLINPTIPNPTSGNINTGELARKKVLIVSGLHGWELASQFNTYIFAKHLCECADYNYYAFRASVEFYIVPCVNGYGAYHKARTNGNRVDINRNFPTDGWTLTGEGTVYYSGPSAGSEFETQLIVALAESIKPNIAIDHHSYGGTSYNFYVDYPTTDVQKLVYQSLVRYANRCSVDYPQFFGKGIALKPNMHRGGSTPTCDNWFYANGIPITSTVEVCHTIAFKDGVYDENTGTNNYMKEDAVKLNELLLRLLLVRYLNSL